MTVGTGKRGPSGMTRFDARHQAALDVLLAGGSQREAAAAASVDERTLRRWRQEAVFARRLDEAQAELVKEVRRAITSRTVKAVDELHAIATGTARGTTARQTVRVQAARALLQAYVAMEGRLQLDVEHHGQVVHYVVEGVDMAALR